MDAIDFNRSRILMGYEPCAPLITCNYFTIRAYEVALTVFVEIIGDAFV